MFYILSLIILVLTMSVCLYTIRCEEALSLVFFYEMMLSNNFFFMAFFSVYGIFGVLSSCFVVATIIACGVVSLKLVMDYKGEETRASSAYNWLYVS